MAAILTTAAVIVILSATAIVERLRLEQERRQRAAELAAIRRDGDRQFRAMLDAWQTAKATA